MAQSNVQRLIEAGMLDPNATLSAQDLHVIDSIDPEDLQTMIRVFQDLPPEFIEEHMRQKLELIF